MNRNEIKLRLLGDVGWQTISRAGPLIHHKSDSGDAKFALPTLDLLTFEGIFGRVITYRYLKIKLTDFALNRRKTFPVSFKRKEVITIDRVPYGNKFQISVFMVRNNGEIEHMGDIFELCDMLFGYEYFHHPINGCILHGDHYEDEMKREHFTKIEQQLYEFLIN